MQLQVVGGVYPMVAFLDEYSRYIVHHEILLSMDGLSVSTTAQTAIETLPKGLDDKPSTPPEMRSDNGSCYISKEFRVVLTENGQGHHRIQPHCPEENGLMERARPTIRQTRCRPYRLLVPVPGEAERANRSASSGQKGGHSPGAGTSAPAARCPS